MTKPVTLEKRGWPTLRLIVSLTLPYQYMTITSVSYSWLSTPGAKHTCTV